jgi:catechol 2,3-dioxygenase-like lactoylglutathione lyase family enzyme
VRAVVEGIGFDIAPWSATVVETELRKRGLNPVPDNDGRGFESFHVKDPDGFDVQLSNGQGNTKRRGRTKTSLSLPTSIEPTGWRTVWLDHLSFRVSDYKRSVSFYANLLGWQPTYDEGSQNELMIADIGDIIIRGGNPLDPRFGIGAAGEAGLLDHISFGIVPWNTDRVKVELEKRGLAPRVDTADSGEIGSAPYKSYHITTPNGYNLQISYITRNRRLTLANAVHPKPQAK